MDGEIQNIKSMVHYWEEKANRYGEELISIKEEGLFCVEWRVEWRVFMSLSTVISLLLVQHG